MNHWNRLLWTGPCGVKPRPAGPNRYVSSVLFWDNTQHWVVILYWCFGTYWSHLEGSRNPKGRTQLDWTFRQPASFPFAGEEAPNPVNTLFWIFSVPGHNNQTTKELTEGRDLHFCASRCPWICLAIPALNALLGSATDTLNCNWDCAYRNDFTSRLKTLTRVKWGLLLRTQ